ncbi:MAG: COX15/CtaA family protein [Deltaproteobacteria bacterium]|nr:COX15/CtaA family protein [Deltaproteobacteria bacterium]
MISKSISTGRFALISWLAVVSFLIFSMVVIGGVTRLTHSGLSMVEWKPLMGAIPPLHEQAWQEVFQKYQQSPEYQVINQGMTLQKFKSIFFWEYFHRLLGRLIGLVFIVPYFFFLWKGTLPKGLAQKLIPAFFIGGLEGVMGWLMVKSGLVDLPRVSPYRLAAHLLIAFFLFAYLFWILLDLIVEGELENLVSEAHICKLKSISRWILALIVLAVIYGALTAGLKAGYGYNTFPKMDGEWFPSGFFALQPHWRNFFENGVSVQFIHRTIGILLLVTVTSFWVYARRWVLSPRQFFGVNFLLLMVLVQVFLGITTLLLIVPVSLAVLHQAIAFILFAVAIFMVRTFSE